MDEQFQGLDRFDQGGDTKVDLLPDDGVEPMSVDVIRPVSEDPLGGDWLTKMIMKI